MNVYKPYEPSTVRPLVDRVPWGSDYRKLTKLFEGQTFEQALGSFVRLTNLEDVAADGFGENAENLLEKICGPNGLVPANLSRIDSRDSKGLGVSSPRVAFNERAESFNSLYGDIIHPALAEVLQKSHSSLERWFRSVSDELGGFDPERRGQIVNLIGRKFGGDDILADGGTGRLSYSTMLYVLLMKRFKYRIYPFSEEPIARPDLRDDSRRWLTLMMFMNHWALWQYRDRVGDSAGFPIARACNHKDSILKEFCYSVLRLVLGREDDFSEVLQEDFITKEVQSIADGHGFGDEIRPVIRELKDLRSRLFEHTNLVSTPASVLLDRRGQVVGREPCFPPAFMIGPRARTGIDIGSGVRARFAYAAAKNRPHMDWFAYDQKMSRQRRSSRRSGVPNLKLRGLNLNDPDALDNIYDEVLGSARKFNGKIDVVMASNILHKLKDPKKFFAELVTHTAGGVTYVVTPAFSNYKYNGFLMDRDSMDIMARQDDTKRELSILSFEDWLGLFKHLGLVVIGFSRLGRGKGENDTGVPRWSFALAPKDKADRIVQDLQWGTAVAA